MDLPGGMDQYNKNLNKIKEQRFLYFVFIDARSQFPLQQQLNGQLPQSLFPPQQQFPDSGISFSAPPQPSLEQLSSALGLTPLQHILPQRMSQSRRGFPQNLPMTSLGQGLSPETVNVPLAAPQKIPSFLTESQVYRDFEDVNSRSHLSDDIIGSQSKSSNVICVLIMMSLTDSLATQKVAFSVIISWLLAIVCYSWLNYRGSH